MNGIEIVIGLCLAAFAVMVIAWIVGPDVVLPW